MKDPANCYRTCREFFIASDKSNVHVNNITHFKKRYVANSRSLTKKELSVHQVTQFFPQTGKDARSGDVNGAR